MTLRPAAAVLRALIPVLGVFILVHYFPMATIAVRVVVVVVVALTVHFAVGCWLFPLWWIGFLDVFFNEGVFSKKGREYVADGLDTLLRLPYYGAIMAVAVLACLGFILGAFFNLYPFGFVDRFAGSIQIGCLVVLAIIALMVSRSWGNRGGTLGLSCNKTAVGNCRSGQAPVTRLNRLLSFAARRKRWEENFREQSPAYAIGKPYPGRERK